MVEMYINYAAYLFSLSLSLSLSLPPPPPPPPHTHRGMVYGRQGDIRASLLISWQELSAYPSHASGQTHQLFSQILLSMEEKLLPVLSHGQTVQEERKTTQVSDNEHCKLERVSCNFVLSGTSLLRIPLG